jgi:hypothetical protein
MNDIHIAVGFSARRVFSPNAWFILPTPAKRMLDFSVDMGGLI